MTINSAKKLMARITTFSVGTNEIIGSIIAINEFDRNSGEVKIMDLHKNSAWYPIHYINAT